MVPKLFIIPHAGGSSYSYYGFTKIKADIVLLDLPGHGIRINEPLLDSLDEIVDDLFSFYFKPILENHSLSGQPFFLFLGRSFIFGSSNPSLCAFITKRLWISINPDGPNLLLSVLNVL